MILLNLKSGGEGADLPALKIEQKECLFICPGLSDPKILDQVGSDRIFGDIRHVPIGSRQNLSDVGCDIFRQSENVESIGDSI
jgi:hypothetical protein